MIYPYEIALILKELGAKTEEEISKVLAIYKIDENLRIPFNQLK